MAWKCRAECLIKEESAVWENQTLAAVQRVATYLESTPTSDEPVDPHMRWEAERQALMQQYMEASEAVTEDMSLAEEENLIGPSSDAMRALMAKIKRTIRAGRKDDHWRIFENQAKKYSK